MSIPKIIHQTWKTTEIPTQFKNYPQKVKDLHPDWQYILWSDEDIDKYVKKEFPEFYPVFTGFSKNIMRVDVIRYLIMYKIGGLYLDLDYEMIKPFDLFNYNIVLPRSRSIEFGDKINCIGNCIFASVPNHAFWKEAIEDLKTNPPVVDHFLEVLDATGPSFLTKIYYNGNYTDIYVPERLMFHPPNPKKRTQYETIINNGISYGIHHCTGTWGEEMTWNHMKMKVKKFLHVK